MLTVKCSKCGRVVYQGNPRYLLKTINLPGHEGETISFIEKITRDKEFCACGHKLGKPLDIIIKGKDEGARKWTRGR